MITISNGILSASINELGAELNSLKDVKTGKEYIWQGDPAYWEGHAPVLFPAVGKVLEDEFVYKGKKYKMPKHGFASFKPFTSKLTGCSSVELTLVQDEETRSAYPFCYSFSTKFSLNDKSLNVLFTVKNEGGECMYTSAGFHPAFNIEQDTTVEFEKEERNVFYYEGEKPITDSGYSLRENRYLDIGKHTFDNDKTIVLEYPNSGKVVLKDKSGKAYLEHRFKNNNVIWIWSISGAPYICIEPWAGSMERYAIRELEKKKGIIKIDPNNSFVLESIISVI